MKNFLTILTAIAIVTIVPIKAYADTNYYVESDPFAFALNGHSVHVGVEGNHYRFQVGTFGATLPDAFKDNSNLDVDQAGYGMKFDIFSKKDGGMFVGLEYGMTKVNFKHAATNSKTQRDSNLLGVRVGYKYRFNKTFYLMPWVGIDRNISDTSTVNLAGEDYNIQKWFIFPTMHIGMQF